MPPSLTREQVQSMAPDTASIKSGTGLANDSKWQSLGINEEALWGECKGSGKKPYQTQVDLSSYSAKCSCPSRKFPCKHSLGILFLYADQVSRLSTHSEPPQWVSEWIESRKERAVKKEERVANAKPVDPIKHAAAAAKRIDKRWDNVQAGATELQRWLNDQFQQGFASFSSAQYKEGSNMAARMVDAQAPNIGRMLQGALSHIRSGQTSLQKGIEQLGLIQILLTALLRKDDLSPEKQADLQTAIGWSLDKEEVQTISPHIKDQWSVLGQVTEELDNNLTERRIWLYGKTTKQFALLLDFAFKGQGLDWSWHNQATYNATLAYYPSSKPMRAVVIEQDPNAAPCPWPALDLKSSIDNLSALFANNPWLPQAPILIPDALPYFSEDQWLIKTTEGTYALALDEANLWNLMAFSSGNPLHVFAEWSDGKLKPLAACHQENPSVSDAWVLMNQAEV